MSLPSDKFNYVHSCDIKTYLSIKIGSLEGKRQKLPLKELLDNPVLKHSGRNQECSDLIVECIVFSGRRKITLPISTSYKAFTTRWNWNEWLELPVRFCDLQRNASLLITIYDYEAPRKRVPVGGTSISLFGSDGVFPRGLHDLRVWPGVEAHQTDTPGQGPLEDSKNDQMHRLNKLVKRHESGQIPRVDWLDRLVFREIEIINDKEKKSSSFMYLMVEFPKVEIKGSYYHVIWWENMVEPENYNLNRYFKGMTFYDPELGLENLHESKHHHLSRSLQSGVTDKDLKPNSTNRDILFSITQYPPTRQLTSDEQDLIWKYRFFLSNLKKGLPKFLKCVNWNLDKEAEQALTLLHKWSPPDPHDALELLGPDFTRPEVRKYAVDRLKSADDEELLLYLLQLVQALRYESWEIKSMNLLDVSHYSLGSEVGADPGNFSDSLLISNQQSDKVKSEAVKPEEHENVEGNPFGNSGQDLASFLIKRSCQNNILASYLYWYLLIECEDKSAEHGVKQESKVRF
ncbi:UNVERIFIED_CONTAM: hypothetical protein GTU68_017099 [Idotea baltica]|nr:hypothetical protein [Idotea baltica]